MTKKIERVQSDANVFTGGEKSRSLLKTVRDAATAEKGMQRKRTTLLDELQSGGVDPQWLGKIAKEERESKIMVCGEEVYRLAFRNAVMFNWTTGRYGADSAKLLFTDPKTISDETLKEQRTDLSRKVSRDMNNLIRDLSNRIGKTGSAGNVGKGKKTDDEIVADLLDRIFRKLTSEKTELTGDVLPAIGELRDLANTLGLVIASDK